MSFRLPPETHVGAVRLQVTDLERSIDYYEQVIGLHPTRADANHATLRPRGDDRVLVHLETRPGVKTSRRGALGLYHFAILLPDRAALGRFAAHLAALEARVGSADHLVSEAFYLWDPDGLGIEVYADRPREEWRVNGGELVMTQSNRRRRCSAIACCRCRVAGGTRSRTSCRRAARAMRASPTRRSPAG